MSRYDTALIKQQNPILSVVEGRYGLKRAKIVSGEVYFLCPFHNEDTPSFRVNENKGVFTCGGCNEGGDVFKFVMKKEGVTFSEACRILGGEPGQQWKPLSANGKNGSEKKESAEDEKRDWTRGLEPTAIYDYLDEFGTLRFQSLRYERQNPEKEKGYEKTFRQRRPDGKNGWIWNTKGISMVIYRLPELLAKNGSLVQICEGEKDCDTLWDNGFVATTNVCGAGKWKDPFSESLRDREVVIWPDQDDIGREHARQVFDSVSKRAKNVRIVNVPAPFKDVTEWWEGFVGTDAEFSAEIQKAIDATTPLYRGTELPVKTMDELEQVYIRTAKSYKTETYNLASWIPSFRNSVRGLVPGELVLVMGETGIGKTCILANIAISAKPLPTLLFEIELPDELTFERFVSAGITRPCSEVYETYAGGGTMDWKGSDRISHISVCSKSDLSCDDIERIIVNSELKIGSRPVLVLIDYVGLVKSVARSRYERASDVAERMKVIAKSTRTIIVIASQIHRRLNAESPEISLFDAKDSGSLENSSGLVLGAWRDQEDATMLKLKVLKNTKGRPGLTVDCNFDGSTMSITERSKISDEDVPQQRTMYEAD